MLKIIIFNFLALFWYFSTGAICALVYTCSPWWLFLLCLPVSFGWFPFAEISKRMEKHIDGTSTVIMLDFFFSIIILLLCTKYLRGSLFTGITILIGLILTAIASAMLMFRLRNMLIDRA